MEEFSISDVAFTGFRVVREHPRCLAVWWLYALAQSVLLTTLTVVLAGPLAGGLTPSPGAANQAQVLAEFEKMTPVYLVILAISLVSNAVLGAAMLRAVFSPEDDRFGYLRLGADEVRQFGLGLQTFLVIFGAYFGCVALVTVMAGVASFAGPFASGLVVFLGVVASAATLIWIALRLSLAPSHTFDSKSIRLFGSWAMTEGRVWRLFGVYALVSALIVVVYLLSFMIIYAVFQLLGGGDLLTSLTRPPTGDFASRFTLPLIVRMVMFCGVSALIWPVAMTPAAAIYRAVVGVNRRDVDVFL